jgi:bromodomain adjacent to zinc finger domain protein 1A
MNGDSQTTDDKKPVIVDAKRIEATLKYPMEDLNIPAYRRDPSGFGPIVDMTPGTKGHNVEARNPTGGMPIRPQFKRSSTVPEDCYGSFLMVWSFLGVFSHSLKLSPFGLDDFENALHHKSHATILIECNIALLNAIIKQRDRLKKESLGHGSTAMQAAISLFGSGYQSCRTTTTPLIQQHPFRQHEANSQYNSEDENDDDHIWRVRPPVQKRIAVAERGCGSPEVEAISHNWDNGTVDTEDERVGWEDILIGFINQLAPLELLADVDRILRKLVPHEASTLEERERAYIDLSLRDKIKIFELLLSVANESHVIK